ncbi:MAG: hypothetical protein AMS14_04295, partial [Planctomycetes bacterium DG_20]
MSPHLEIAEVASRLVGCGGPAALFENVAGHAMPVLVGAFASMKRMAWALGGEDLDEIASRLAALLRPPAADAGMIEKIKA